MQNCHPEHNINRLIRQRQIVRRTDDEFDIRCYTISGEALARDVDQIGRNVEGFNSRAPARQHDGIQAVAASIFEYGLAAHIAEQMVGIFERVAGVGGRIKIGRDLRFINEKISYINMRRFGRAPLDFGALPLVEYR